MKKLYKYFKYYNPTGNNIELYGNYNNRDLFITKYDKYYFVKITDTVGINKTVSACLPTIKNVIKFIDKEIHNWVSIGLNY
jgi:hypothetical protein